MPGTVTFLLDVPEDLGLLAAGVIGAIVMLGPAQLPSHFDSSQSGPVSGV
jgi:hypothetical protein